MSEPCRVCMCSDFELASRVYDYFEGTRISEQIMTICNVTISQEDGLPDLICPDCLHQLQNAFEFKLKCEKTDTILRETFTDINVNRDVKNITPLCDNLKIEFETDVKEEETYCDEKSPELDVDLDRKPLKCSTLPTGKKYKGKEFNHKCIECGMSFRTKQERKTHLKQHNFTCETCKRQFKSKSAIENHFKRKNRDCQLISSDKSLIVQGVGKNRIFCCVQCNYKTNRLIHMRPHLVTHTGMRPFACDLCPCAYTQLGPLTYHKQMVHEKKDLSITCEICGKKLPSKRHFYKHLRVHSEAKYSCDVCNVRLKSKTTLAKHMIRHMGVKNFTCDVCASAFFTQSELYNHIRIHRAVENRRTFACPRCEYRATKKFCLEKHLARHSDDKPFSCQNCGQLYETQDLLDKHTRIHDKIFKCPVCENKYSKIVYLKRHLGKHHKVNVGTKDLNADIQLFKDMQSVKKISSRDVPLLLMAGLERN